MMPKVLIVDDDPEIVASVVTFLSLEGWTVCSAGNGQEALEMLDSSFDGVILDLHMPVMDGEKTLVEIRKRFNLASVCVVILTAFGEVGSAVSSIRQGAYQYLQKPFQLDDLSRVLVAGIVKQKADSLRRDLLASLDTDVLLERICSIIAETINPHGLYLFFLSPDGSIKEVIGGTIQKKLDRMPYFLQHILDVNQPVFIADEQRISQWEPIRGDTLSLLAVPVPGQRGSIVGVIDIESHEKNAFDPNWVEALRYLSDLAGISMEITEKARRNTELVAERERKDAEMMAEREHWKKMPTLINDLGHHILTPVQVITLQAQTLMAKELKAEAIAQLPEKLVADITRRVNVIGRNAETIARVCDYLRDVSQPIPINKRQVDLGEVLDSCIEEYLSELDDKQIALQYHSPGPLLVDADPGLVKYSLQCVMSNAIEAIEQRRASQTETPAAALDQPTRVDQIEIKLWSESATAQVCLAIHDTGIGIDRNAQENIFEPLFTTKRGDHLSGMGLFSARRIMNEHQGSITVASHQGQGATFTLCLPTQGDDPAILPAPDQLHLEKDSQDAR